MAMIKLTGINKIYRTNEIETLALENVNLDVAKGEFVSIMGPSGCGKSTLLNIMGLLDAPSSGKIEINGTSVESMKDKELAAFRNKTLGFVFQSFHLINSLNVIDNVELPLLYRKMAAKERMRERIRRTLAARASGVSSPASKRADLEETAARFSLYIPSSVIPVGSPLSWVVTTIGSVSTHITIDTMINSANNQPLRYRRAHKFLPIKCSIASPSFYFF